MENISNLTEKRFFDVLIIGAGPAGTSCARELKSRNIEVAVLERKRLPRFKACGGLLSQRAATFLDDYFGALPDELICFPEFVRTKYSRSGRGFVPISPENMRSIKRHQFDAWLAQKANAPLFERVRYRQHVEERDRIRVSVSAGDRELNLNCRYLVGADGGNSRVRRAIDPRFGSSNRLGFIQGVFRGEAQFDKTSYYFLAARQLTDLFACFCQKDDLIYAGTTFYLKNRDKGYRARLLDYLKEQFGFFPQQRVRWEGCVFGLSLQRSPFHFGAGRTLLVGEAAGLLTAFGEGIPSALISGQRAGQAIATALATEKNALELYLKAIEDEKNHIRHSRYGVS